MADIIPDSASVIVLQTNDGLALEVNRVKDKGISIIIKREKSHNPLIRLSLESYRYIFQSSESIESVVYYLTQQEEELKRRQAHKERLERRMTEVIGISETKQDATIQGNTTAGFGGS